LESTAFFCPAARLDIFWSAAGPALRRGIVFTFIMS